MISSMNGYNNAEEKEGQGLGYFDSPATLWFCDICKDMYKSNRLAKSWCYNEKCRHVIVGNVKRWATLLCPNCELNIRKEEYEAVIGKVTEEQASTLKKGCDLQTVRAVSGDTKDKSLQEHEGTFKEVRARPM